MNYLELINQFWRLDLERPFPASDTRLYFFLLNSCNRLKWKNPFGHSDRYLAVNVGVSVNTIRASKIRLVKAGLITVSTPLKPSKSFEGQTLYFLKTVSNSDTDHTTVSINDTDPDTVPDTDPDTNYKLNKTKHNDINKKENEIQFSVLNKMISVKYPKVSTLNEQLTLAEYDSLMAEYNLRKDQIFNLLDRMENHKPLLANCNSVYRTLRNWHKTDLDRSNRVPLIKNTFRHEYIQKQSQLNEGPTLGSR